MSWVRIPPEQLFFLFGEKRVVWVSCLSLFSIYRKEFSCAIPGYFSTNAGQREQAPISGIVGRSVYYGVPFVSKLKMMLVFTIHAGIYDSCWYLHFMLIFTLHAGIYDA